MRCLKLEGPLADPFVIATQIPRLCPHDAVAQQVKQSQKATPANWKVQSLQIQVYLHATYYHQNREYTRREENKMGDEERWNGTTSREIQPVFQPRASAASSKRQPYGRVDDCI